MALDKGRLEEIATAIALMYDSEVYSKLKTEINKPMADVPAGHALNINWDNIVNSYKVIKDFLKETIYKEDMSMENVGSKLVQRGTNGGIKVGDVYCENIITTVAATNNFVPQIAYKDNNGYIQFCNDKGKFQNWVEVQKLINWKKIWSGSQQGDITHEDISGYNEILFIWTGYNNRIISLSTPIDAWLTYNQVTMVQRGGENGDRDYDGYVTRVSNTITRIKQRENVHILKAIYVR